MNIMEFGGELLIDADGFFFRIFLRTVSEKKIQRMKI